jgi:hypothetical protein
MQKRLLAAKILAALGTLVVWLPLLAPAVLGLFHLARAGRYAFDYLMPAELFPVALAGSLLLVAAALLARAQRRLILISLLVALAALIGATVLAEVSGLARGAIEPQGIWWALVVGLFILYSLGLVAVGIGGTLLLRRLFRGQQPPRPAPA